MRYIELTKEQESKWLKHLKNDKAGFLSRLLIKLENDYKENDVKLVLGNSLLREMFIETKKVSKNPNNKNCVETQDIFVDIASYSNSLLKDICKYLDFRNLEYQNLLINETTINYFRRYNIPIEPSKLYQKSLQGMSFEESIFRGSFDDCNIANATLWNCRDINGKRVKINPQTVKDKNFSSCVLRGVEFLDNFDGCKISSARIIDCNNAMINPQKIAKKNFKNSNLSGVDFTENFDGCYIVGLRLNNCNNVIINPQKILNRDFSDVDINGAKFTDSINNCIIFRSWFVNVSNLFVDAEMFEIKKMEYGAEPRFAGITIYIRNQNGVDKLIEEIRKISYDSTIKIVCESNYCEELRRKSSFFLRCFKECVFEILHSEIDDAINEVFLEKNLIEETVVKQKKKSIFDRFRRKRK